MNPSDSILITGGSGMLATAFRRLLPQARFAGRAELDVADEAACRRLFQDQPPSILINCAAYTKVDLAEREQEPADQVNGHGVGRLARLCREHGTTLVHFSTDYVFDGTLRRPLRPEDPVGPHSAYGRSKLLGERLLQENAPPRWLIIRTAWLYGPGGPCFPQAILNAARAGKPLTVVNDQTGCPTYTDDLAAATVELIERGANGIWHFTNDGPTTWFEFAAAILEQFAVPADLKPITSADWKRSRPESATRPAYSVLDLAPYERLSGRRPRHWRQALHDYRLSIGG